MSLSLRGAAGKMKPAANSAPNESGNQSDSCAHCSKTGQNSTPNKDGRSIINSGPFPINRSHETSSDEANESTTLLDSRSFDDAEHSSCPSVLEYCNSHSRFTVEVVDELPKKRKSILKRPMSDLSIDTHICTKITFNDVVKVCDFPRNGKVDEIRARDFAEEVQEEGLEQMGEQQFTSSNINNNWTPNREEKPGLSWWFPYCSSMTFNYSDVSEIDEERSRKFFSATPGARRWMFLQMKICLLTGYLLSYGEIHAARCFNGSIFDAVPRSRKMKKLVIASTWFFNMFAVMNEKVYPNLRKALLRMRGDGSPHQMVTKNYPPHLVWPGKPRSRKRSDSDEEVENMQTLQQSEAGPGFPNMSGSGSGKSTGVGKLAGAGESAGAD